MKTQSQTQMILQDLLTGCRITAIEALERYGCFRLSARINELIRDGFNIEGDMIETPSGKKVKQYYLKP